MQGSVAPYSICTYAVYYNHKYVNKNMRSQKNTRRSQTRWYKKLSFVLPAVVIVIGLSLAALEATNTTGFFHNRNPGLVTTPITPNRSAGPETKGEEPKAEKEPSAAPPETEPATNATLKDPLGTFVSNHHPNLDGSPNPDQIQSVCETTPGAICKIVFIKGSVTKQLPPQKTDGEGAAYWSWKLKDIGLTEGSWKVQAVAQLGNQEKTTDDALALEIEP